MFFEFGERLTRLAEEAQRRMAGTVRELETVSHHNQAKVLKAFRDGGISESHFAPTTGYGYGDRGRDALDAVYAQVFHTEDALVRHQFVSGTHALATALFGVLRPGDTLLSLTGRPYDTLEETIGLKDSGNGSLREFGVRYEEVPLTDEGRVDLGAVAESAPRCKVAYIQRSRGYSLRPSLSVAEIAGICDVVRRNNPNAVILVDNCYGEFTERLEPTEVGADMAAGSLIKNPGGGLASTGGYIVGPKALIMACASRLSAPGMGKEVGASLGELKSMFMGLFMAPHVVCQALKTAVFAAALFEQLGYPVYPGPDEMRSDIIQAVALGDRARLIAFCQGIQSGSPVDAHVLPEPWAMPGYDSEVIMAAGGFTMGASIELSADAPLREPFAVYLQGGLTFESGRIGVLSAAAWMAERGLLEPGQPAFDENMDLKGGAAE